MAKKMDPIQEFLHTLNVLVVDTSGAHRSSIRKAVIFLGAKTANVKGAQTYHQALEMIQNSPPDILISEYKLENFYGLDLIEKQKEHSRDENKRMFILATGTSTESSVAEAAEEDVDQYIVKPFTGDSLDRYLREAILRKLSPTPYALKIEEAKAQMAGQDFEGAIATLVEAKEMTEKPSLACYYIGRCYLSLSEHESALESFREGLTHKELHYKCLKGQFEVLDKMKKLDECYKAAQKLVEHFPVSPNLLEKLFYLAVQTRNFNDVNRYYKLFTELERRPERLTKVIVAGLITCGKFLLKQNEIEEADQTFERAAVSSGRSAMFLNRIIQVLIDAECTDLASKFLAYYDAEDQADECYTVFDFLVHSLTIGAEASVMKGRKVLKDGVVNYQVYAKMIQLYLELEKEDSAEEIFYLAKAAFPDKESSLNAFFEEDAA